MENIKIKTGLDMLKSDNQDIEIDDKTLSIILLIVQKSFETALKYFEHSDRELELSYDDIIVGFKYEAHNFFDRPELDTDFPRMLQLINDMNNSNDDEISEDEMSENEDDETGIANDDTFELNKCECDFCKKCNLHTKEWDNWTPDDPIKLLIKNMIDSNALNLTF